MNRPVLVLFLLNFVYIGILPRVFFRKDGSFNLKWWVTAAPFFICATYLVCCFYGIVQPITGYHSRVSAWLEIAAVPFSIASIGLISFTLGTHRVPVSLWHQDNDGPGHLVTFGAYARIRHPFYASFLLALLGALVLSPHPVTALAFSFGFIVLAITAAGEEKRLLLSRFGADYHRYMNRTGRFLPVWRGSNG